MVASSIDIYVAVLLSTGTVDIPALIWCGILVSSLQTLLSGVVLIDWKLQAPPPRGSGEMPITYLFSLRIHQLASDNWCLITTQDIKK